MDKGLRISSHQPDVDEILTVLIVGKYVVNGVTLYAVKTVREF